MRRQTRSTRMMSTYTRALVPFPSYLTQQLVRHFLTGRHTNRVRAVSDNHIKGVLVFLHKLQAITDVHYVNSFMKADQRGRCCVEGDPAPTVRCIQETASGMASLPTLHNVHVCMHCVPCIWKTLIKADTT